MFQPNEERLTRTLTNPRTMTTPMINRSSFLLSGGNSDAVVAGVFLLSLFVSASLETTEYLVARAGDVKVDIRYHTHREPYGFLI